MRANDACFIFLSETLAGPGSQGAIRVKAIIVVQGVVIKGDQTV